MCAKIYQHLGFTKEETNQKRETKGILFMTCQNNI